MRLIDTHCHLAHARLRPDLDAVLDRAAQAGVVACICAVGDLAEAAACAEMTASHAMLSNTAGIHPHEAKDVPPDYLATIERFAANPRCVAVGEVGLDYHYNFSPPEAQRRVFGEQAVLAGRLGKPLVVHTREAFDDTMDVLRASGIAGEKVVFHSFTESAQCLRRALDFGAMISFSGIVTFRPSEALRLAAALVPADRMLVETDSPYLSPEPVRKIKTNEPAHVAHVARRLAGVRHVEPEELAEQTTANAIRFFGIPVVSAR